MGRAGGRSLSVGVMGVLASCSLFSSNSDLSGGGSGDPSRPDAESEAATTTTGTDASDGVVQLGTAADLVTGQVSVGRIVADDSALYWFTDPKGPDASPAVMRSEKDGGAPTAFTFGTGALGDPVALAQDTTRLYVASRVTTPGDYEMLHRIEKLTGGVSTFQIGFQHEMFDLVVVGTDAILSWRGMYEGKVLATPTESWVQNQARVIASDPPGAPLSSVTALAADHSYVYAATNGAILRIQNQTDGGRDSFATTDGTAKALLLASGVLYWIEGSKIMSLAVDANGAAPAKLSSADNDPRGIAVRGDDLYWTDANLHAVVRASRIDGSGATTLASGQAEPTAITVDDAGAVFWVDRAASAIRGVRPL